jgi:hypothetical protein
VSRATKGQADPKSAPEDSCKVNKGAHSGSPLRKLELDHVYLVRLMYLANVAMFKANGY